MAKFYKHNNATATKCGMDAQNRIYNEKKILHQPLPSKTCQRDSGADGRIEWSNWEDSDKMMRTRKKK